MKFSSSRSPLGGLLLACCLGVLCMSLGCSEYWWTRGQPPSVGKLLERSKTQLDSALLERSSVRASLAPGAKDLQRSLMATLQLLHAGRSASDIVKNLEKCQSHFMDLEGRLSIGSRAPYGELAGQMRRFIKRAKAGEGVSFSSFGLFTSRTFSFLANELSVPAPIFS